MSSWTERSACADVRKPCIEYCDWFADRSIETGLNWYRCNLAIELGSGLSGSILVVSAGFKTIRLIYIRSAGSKYLLLIWVDFIWFQRFGQVGRIRIDLWTFEFGSMNLIRVVRFSLLIRAVWVILIEFNRFDGTCVDLGWDDLKGLRWIYRTG